MWVNEKKSKNCLVQICWWITGVTTYHTNSIVKFILNTEHRSLSPLVSMGLVVKGKAGVEGWGGGGGGGKGVVKSYGTIRGIKEGLYNLENVPVWSKSESSTMSMYPFKDLQLKGLRPLQNGGENRGHNQHLKVRSTIEWNKRGRDGLKTQKNKEEEKDAKFPLSDHPSRPANV